MSTPYLLIVDDDPLNRRVLEAMLAGEGYRTVSVGSGRESLAAVGAEPPAVILLDLMMPEMDGFGFLRALRSRPDGDVPVVVLTAKEITAAEKVSLGAQADRVIPKGSLSLAEIGRQLRVLYARSTPETVPGRLQGLIEQLAERDG